MPLEDLIAAKMNEQEAEDAEAEAEQSDDEADKKKGKGPTQKPPQTTNQKTRTAPEGDPSLLGGYGYDAHAGVAPMDAAPDERLGAVVPAHTRGPAAASEDELQTRNVKCMNPKCTNRFEMTGYLGEMISRRCDQCMTTNKIIMHREGNTVTTTYIGNEPQSVCIRCTNCFKVDRKAPRNHLCWCCGACQCCLCCPENCFLHACSCSIQ